MKNIENKIENKIQQKIVLDKVQPISIIYHNIIKERGEYADTNTDYTRNN